MIKLVNTHSTQKDLKFFEDESSGEPDGSPLDYLHISGTKGDSGFRFSELRRGRNTGKFPNDRWHTLSFREFAYHQERLLFGYIGLDYEGNIKEKIGRCAPRWSRWYRRMTYGKVRQFTRVCCQYLGLSEDSSGNVAVDKAHFVTLSVQHPRSESKPAAVKVVNELRYAWNHVRRWLNRKGWQYIRVAEPGDTVTHVHFHMVILGATDEEIEEFKIRWVKACNQHGNKASLKGQDSSRADNIRNLGGYISKYLAKSFEDGSGEDSEWYWKWMELCYSLRLRVFAMDSRSSAAVSKKYRNPLDKVKDLLPGYKLGETLFVPSDKQLDEILDNETLETSSRLKVDKLKSDLDDIKFSEENPHPPEQQPILFTAPAFGGGAKPGGDATPARSVPDLASGRGRRVLGAI